MELHDAAWSHRFNFKYYKSRMETPSIRSRDAWSHMEPLETAWSSMEPPFQLQILQEPYGDPFN